MPRVAPDNNDVIVWRFNDGASPYVNSSTSPSTLGSAVDLALSSGEVNPNCPALFGDGAKALSIPSSAYTGTGNDDFPTGSGATKNRIQSGTGVGVNLAAPLTVSGWVKLRSNTMTNAGYSSAWLCYKHYRTDGTWSSPFTSLDILWFTTGQLRFTVTTGGARRELLASTNDYPLLMAEWSHVGMTFDGSDLVGYLNGEIIASMRVPSTPVAIDYGQNGAWAFGASPNASATKDEAPIDVADWRVANVVRDPSYFKNVFRQGRFKYPAYSEPAAVALRSADPMVGDPTGTHASIITLKGSGFVAGSAVTIGGQPALNVSVVDGTTITCKPPALALGLYNIVVTNPDGGISTLPGGYRSWTPGEITNIDGYFDSRKNVTLSGSDVTAWLNQATGGSYTTTGTPVPTLVANEFGTGIPAVRFGSGSGRLGSAKRPLTSSNSVFWVGKTTSVNTTRPGFGTAQNVVSDDAGVNAWGTNGGALDLYTYSGGSVFTTAGVNLNDGVTRLLGWTHTSTGPVAKPYVRGLQIETNKTPAYSASPGWSHIGANAWHASNGADADVGAVVITNSEISNTDRVRLEHWSRLSFGAATLPAPRLSLAAAGAWRLDEVEGSLVVAGTHAGIHSASVRTGVGGQVRSGARYLGSTSSFSAFGNIFDKERNQAFSVSLWMKATFGNSGYLVAKRSTSEVGGSAKRGWAITLLSSGQVYFNMTNDWGSNALSVDTNNQNYATSAWQHLVVTYDGSSNPNNVNFYNNGVLAGKTVFINGLTQTTVNTDELMFGNGGNRNAVVTQAPYTGYLDDIAIFNGVVTHDDVLRIYTAGLDGVSIADLTP